MTLQEDFDRLLETAGAEAPIQRFLETHPQLLVGSDYVLENAVLSQLRLGTEHRVDFAFIEPTSGPTFLHLFEFESPALALFTGADEFTAPFNHAAQQVRDWVLWCGRHQPELRSLFEPLYEASSERLPGFFVVKTLLVAGRRSEINNTRRRERFESLNSGRAGFDEVRTYDGFREKIDYIFRADVENSRGIRCLWYGNRELSDRRGTGDAEGDRRE